MTRAVDWNFLARREDGSSKVVTFYAYTRRQAWQYALAWAQTKGFTIEAVPEQPSPPEGRGLRA